jgi:hypothetical protein
VEIARRNAVDGEPREPMGRRCSALSLTIPSGRTSMSPAQTRRLCIGRLPTAKRCRTADLRLSTLCAARRYVAGGRAEPSLQVPPPEPLRRSRMRFASRTAFMYSSVARIAVAYRPSRSAAACPVTGRPKEACSPAARPAA